MTHANFPKTHQTKGGWSIDKQTEHFNWRMTNQNKYYFVFTKDVDPDDFKWLNDTTLDFTFLLDDHHFD